MEFLRRPTAAPISDAELTARLQAAIGDASRESAPRTSTSGSPSRSPSTPSLELASGGVTVEEPVADQVDFEQPSDELGQPSHLTSRLQRAYEFGRVHVVAIGVILAGFLGFASFQLLRASAQEVPVMASPVSGGVGSTGSSEREVVASPTAASASALPIQVHVIGEVRRPGVVRLAPGSRVTDAIDAAGGLTPAAQLGDLNLAAPVIDGAQVLVGGGAWPSSTVRAGTSGAGGPSPTQGTGQALVNLNTATAQELEALPGVGPVTAQRILDWRQAHGRFTAVAELQEVTGIGPKLYATLAPLVTV